MAEKYLCVIVPDNSLKDHRLRAGDVVMVDTTAGYKWGDVVAAVDPEEHDIELKVYREQPGLVILGKAVRIDEDTEVEVEI